MTPPFVPLFPHATATVGEIQARAATFVGKTLIELKPNLAPMKVSSATTKGVVGRIYEACFDIPQNSRPGPDFERAAIELKSVPILFSGSEARAKERISVGMIDFDGMAAETWDTAHARRKLERLLLIFYRWEPFRPIASFETLAAGIWSPDSESWSGMQADWELIRALVVAGRRNEVSESLTRLLGAATKGPGHGSVSRAWSLKQPFVGWIYRQMTNAVAEDVVKDENPATAFEARILALLRPHIGKSLDALGVNVGGGKAAVARSVRGLLGQRASGRKGEFERFGIEIKTVPVKASGQLAEAMSFPSFVHEELALESWEDSDLLGRLTRLLIVPVHRVSGTSPGGMRLGRPFFWNPPESDLVGIRREWETYRDLVASGSAAALPKASETQFIHVRPKAKDSRDRDDAPGGFQVIKKCFWLNQPYLRTVLASHDALTLPPPR
jgi:DNA mismatch repair endonuclease MutH